MPRPARRRDVRQKSRGISPYIFLSIGAVAIVAIALGVTLVNQARSPGEAVPLMPAQFRNAHTWLGISMDSNEKGENIPYTTDPPTHGPHTTFLAAWGVHKDPVPRAILIHNMEDGGVVIWYSPTLAPVDTIKKLTEITQRYPKHVVLTPYPPLTTPIVLTAWERILRLDNLDEGKTVEFINAYQGIDHHAR
ncbi:MAG: DUF3105 domain-containing protein [Chloroflexi bacterium]|nr:DUF3105 domain-containing protein [Chloroflexota bacterium]